MFKKLLATTALCLVPVVGFAADLPRRAAAAAPAPVFVAADWSGLYVGIVGGYATGKSHSSATGLIAGAPDTSINLKGALIGGQVGYNYQLSNGLVLGAVADLSWSSVKGTTCVEGRGCDGSFDDSYSKGSLSWLSTVRAKGGFALSNDVLLYATGGLAMAGGKASISYLTSSVDPLVSDKQTLFGWTIGAGIEYKLTQSISLGAEYLYADFGKQDFNLSNAAVLGGAAIGSNSNAKLHIVRASLNYRFGGSAPVVARY